MLKVLFGNEYDEQVIYNTSVYFKNSFEESWITSELAKQIIKDIDKSEVISGNLINSPVLGPITPTSLAGGTKTLLLILNEPEKIFNASTCGDNCAKWILEIAENMDITINLRHLMDFGRNNFKMLVLNNNTEVHSMEELLPIASEYLS